MYIHRPEVNEEFDVLDTDVFPGVYNGCLYFSVESIEFDIQGCLLCTRMLRVCVSMRITK